MKKKVIVYVDGYNFYYGLRNGGMAWKRTYWLDIVRQEIQVSQLWFQEQDIRGEGVGCEGGNGHAHRCLHQALRCERHCISRQRHDTVGGNYQVVCSRASRNCFRAAKSEVIRSGGQMRCGFVDGAI